MKPNQRVAGFLGLPFMIALSLLAFSAAAQAALPAESTPGAYKLLGSEVLVALATFTGGQEGLGILLVPGRNLDVRCTAGHIENGNFRGNQFEALATVLYLGCKAFKHNSIEEIAGCKIPGEMLTANAIFFPELHGGQLFILGVPDGGPSFTTIKFETEKGCVLPIVNEVKGTVSAQVPAAEEVEPLVKFSEAIQKLTGDKLLFGVFEAFANGSAKVHLTGVHVGCKFGVV